jgi:hypothetical protein
MEGPWAQEQGRARTLRVLLLMPSNARISSTVIAPIWPVKLERRREMIGSADVFTACRPSGPGTNGTQFPKSCQSSCLYH